MENGQVIYTYNVLNCKTLAWKPENELQEKIESESWNGLKRHEKNNEKQMS